MGNPNFNLIKLIIDGWVFGKPILLTLIVYVVVRQRLDKKILYLLTSFFGTYGAWYVIGKIMLLWMAGSMTSSTDSIDYTDVIYRTAAVQVVEVLTICCVAYGISRLSWFRKNLSS